MSRSKSISSQLCRLTFPALAVGAACILVGLTAERARAQKPQVSIAFHTDRLPMEGKQYLEGLDRQLTQIVNEYNWMDEGLRYELPLRLEFFFDKWSRQGLYHRYTAGVLAALPSGIQLRDRRSEFRYSRDYPLQVGGSYEPLTGLIEYLVWVCLGFEADRYAQLGGQNYYDKARITAENARFEIDYYTGWEDRRDLARDLSGETYRDIRAASFHVYAGRWFLKKDDSESAAKHLAYAVSLLLKGTPSLMELRRDDNIIRFVDAKELSAALQELKAEELLARLAEWDAENADIYRR